MRKKERNTRRRRKRKKKRRRRKRKREEEEEEKEEEEEEEEEKEEEEEEKEEEEEEEKEEEEEEERKRGREEGGAECSFVRHVRPNLLRDVVAEEPLQDVNQSWDCLQVENELEERDAMDGEMVRQWEVVGKEEEKITVKRSESRELKVEEEGVTNPERDSDGEEGSRKRKREDNSRLVHKDVGWRTSKNLRTRTKWCSGEASARRVWLFCGRS